MNLKRYNDIKSFLPNWEIDVEAGTIKTRVGQVTRTNTQGYLEIHARRNGKHYYFTVHQIIAVAGGLDCIDKSIDHIDGNKFNNRLDNLEAVPQRENVLRARVQGQIPSNFSSKLNWKVVGFIKTLLKYKIMSVNDVAGMLSVSVGCINDLKYGKTWKEVKPINLDDFLCS